MTFAGKIVKIGSAPSKVIPDSIGVRLAGPIFWFIESALNHEEHKISYLGNGSFEYYETNDEKTVGYMEGMLGVLPPFVAIVPLFYTVAFFEGVIGAVVGLPFAIYMLLVAGTLGNVTVKGVSDDD